MARLEKPAPSVKEKLQPSNTLNIKQTNGCISIDQNLYIDELGKDEISSERKLEKHAHLNK